jgi:predicted DsbA family dithiol-disulfide isomerase
MNNKSAVTIEMFYTLTCPNCKILKRMLDELENLKTNK